MYLPIHISIYVPIYSKQLASLRKALHYSKQDATRKYKIIIMNYIMCPSIYLFIDILFYIFANLCFSFFLLLLLLIVSM